MFFALGVPKSFRVIKSSFFSDCLQLGCNLVLLRSAHFLGQMRGSSRLLEMYWVCLMLFLCRFSRMLYKQCVHAMPD